MPSAFFYVLTISLILSILYLGSAQVTETGYEQNTRIRGFSYHFDVVVESYRPMILTAELPPRAMNGSLSVTHIGLFGDKSVEKTNLLGEGNITIPNGGTVRHEIELRFSIPNQTLPSNSISNLVLSERSFPLSRLSWLLVTTVLGIVTSASLIPRRFRSQVLIERSDYRELLSLQGAIEREILEKDLDLDNIKERYDYHAGSATQQLKTLSQVDTYLQGLPPKDRETKETRAALFLLAYIQLAGDIETQARKVRPLLAFSLVQAIDVALLEAVYAPRLLAFITKNSKFKDLGTAKTKLDSALNELRKESVARKGSKLVYGAAITALLTMAFSFPVTNLLLVQLPVFAYTLANMVAFIFTWLQ